MQHQNTKKQVIILVLLIPPKRKDNINNYTQLS